MLDGCFLEAPECREVWLVWLSDVARAHDDCLRYLGCWLEAFWKKSIHSVIA